MAKYDFNGLPMNNVVGNIDFGKDDNAGFKTEVRHVYESYAEQGVDLSTNLLQVLTAPSARESFNAQVLESIQDSPVVTESACVNSPFYSNFYDRVDQLLNNTENAIANESVMVGYSPIVSYMPFTLKKQWIDNIFKDVLMTEIPKSPVINIACEHRYVVNGKTKKEYPLPESLYDDSLVKEMLDASTGTNIKEDPIDITLCKGLNLIDSAYFPGVNAGDPEAELTPDLHIFAVVMADSTGKEHKVFKKINADITMHTIYQGEVSYDVLDADGNVTETLKDELVGSFNYKAGTVTIMSTTGKITKVCLRGKLANRFNRNSLDVIREVRPKQFLMPESGPHMNSAISVEEASDAIALQNIDMIADNINVMGATLANFEDADIKMFLINSFNEQEAGTGAGVLYNELNQDKMTVSAKFDTLPYETYTSTITNWMKESREWFERVISQLKMKLRSSNVMIVAVANPNLIRFLQDGINWVFSNDTQISGVKLSYNFGIYTSAQDRVHIVTSMRLSEDDGIRFIVIPLTQELITFKHYKYNMIIDRNYRDPVHNLLPNIMVTHRTLNVEVYPVQGMMTVENRSMSSPTTLKRDPAPTPIPGT